MHAVKCLQAESVIYDHCTGTVKKKIDQCQLPWYLGQFLRAPAGPGQFLRLTPNSAVAAVALFLVTNATVATVNNLLHKSLHVHNIEHRCKIKNHLYCPKHKYFHSTITLYGRTVGSTGILRNVKRNNARRYFEKRVEKTRLAYLCDSWKSEHVLENKKLSYPREDARCAVSLEMLPSYSRSLKVIWNVYGRV